MRKVAQKKVAKLVLEKDPNMLKSIIKRKGIKTFEKMNGVSIYRYAKQIYGECAIKENWGKNKGE